MTKQDKTSKHLEQQVQDLDEKWKRALADYQNLEKRVSTQQQLFAKMANLALIEKLLPVFDDLKRASGHIQDNGLAMIVNQLDKILEEDGIKKINALGHMFDAHSMECIETVPGDKDVVTEVLTDGYILGDTVIRPARVKVGNGQKGTETKN